MHPTLWLGFLICVAASALTPNEMVKRADEARGPSGTFSFQVRVTDAEAEGGERETTYRVYSKDLQYTLVQTIAPERLKGRKLLMRGHDLWLYLPTVKRPTRVSFQQRLTGEVANGDIARANFAEDYDATLSGEASIAGRPCHRLELKAKHKNVTYASIRYWIDRRTLEPVRTDFFAISGKLLKTGVYSGMEPVLGKRRATRLTITDALQPSKRSVLSYSDYRREDLGDAFFNKETLAE